MPENSHRSRDDSANDRAFSLLEACSAVTSLSACNRFAKVFFAPFQLLRHDHDSSRPGA
jgi:hypothetical protein